MVHMGKVHNMVTTVCDLYFQKMRRNVYVTPKSYLSFIAFYRDIYKKKYDAIDVEENNIIKGLDRLAEASVGVEELKVDLKKEDARLKEATESTEKLLKELEIQNREADKQARDVNAVADACHAQRNQIEQEQQEAEKDLAIALPYLRAAENAVKSIKS